MQNEINQTERPPISADLLSSYLRGTALDAERKQIDLLLQEDEMLQEAMEGLKQMNNPAMLVALANEMNQTIGIKSGFVLPKSKLFHISSAAIKPTLAIAASLVVVAGSFFLLQQYSGSQKDLALAKKQDTTATLADEAFEKTDIYSDSSSNQLIGLKKTVNKEEAILNQQYIDQLDSTNAKNAMPNLNVGTVPSIVIASNMMNPMKSMTAGMLNKMGDNPSGSGVQEKNPKQSQNTLVLKGQVIDNSTNQPIKGASIIVDGKMMATSNINGFYEVPIESGKHDIVYAQLGYDDEKQQLLLNGETKKQVNVALNQSLVASNGLAAKYEDQTAKANDQSIASGASTIIGNSADKNTNSTDNAALKTGLNDYSAQNYNGAISNLSKTLANDPNNKDALFYLAMSHYNLGNMNKAISYYSKTISNGGKYREDALWYKAQILLQQKNTEQARTLLEALKDTKYSQRSVKLLESIDK